MLKKLLLIACLGAIPGLAHAQGATPTEVKVGDLQIGAGIDLLRDDYLSANYEGFTFYADFDFLTHYGIEGEFRQSGIGAQNSAYQRDYLIGPRFVLHYKSRFNPYAKFLIGRGVYNFPATPATPPTPPTATSPGSSGSPGCPNPCANLAYNMFAVGGGLDIQVLNHLNVRAADVEYQRWLGFQKSTLTPIVFTFGVAYHF